MFSTTLGALSLMVTYRYLPTTQADRIQSSPPAPEDSSGEDDDLIEFVL